MKTKLDLNHLSHWQLHALIGGICLATLVAGVLLGVWPAYESSMKHAQLLEAETQQKQRLDEAQQALEKMRLAMQRTAQRLDGAKITLRPAQQINEQLARITDLALRSGLNIAELEPLSSTQAERYQRIGIEMIAQGHYHQCARFLHAVHEHLEDTALLQFSLMDHGEDETQTPAQFQAVLIWHALPDAQSNELAEVRHDALEPPAPAFRP